MLRVRPLSVICTTLYIIFEPLRQIRQGEGKERVLSRLLSFYV